MPALQESSYVFMFFIVYGFLLTLIRVRYLPFDFEQGPLVTYKM